MFTKITDAFRPGAARSHQHEHLGRRRRDRGGEPHRQAAHRAGGPVDQRVHRGAGASALDQGFEAYVIADACGDVSVEAHERAMQRMIQLGASPMTSLQYLLELQRDWARGETYDPTTGIARASGAAPMAWGSPTPKRCSARPKADTDRRQGRPPIPPPTAVGPPSFFSLFCKGSPDHELYHHHRRHPPVLPRFRPGRPIVFSHGWPLNADAWDGQMLFLAANASFA
jgi:hypothetical protein